MKREDAENSFYVKSQKGLDEEFDTHEGFILSHQTRDVINLLIHVFISILAFVFCVMALWMFLAIIDVIGSGVLL